MPRATRSRGPGDRAEVEVAYRRFWEVAQRLDQYPRQQWRRRLAEVAAEPLLTRVLDGLASRRRAGYRQFGMVIPRPVVVGIAGERASILDCQDASRSGEMDEGTGQIGEVGRSRTPVAATVTRGADGRWRVNDAEYLAGDC